MTFIQTVPPEEASGTLKEFYDADIRESGYVENSTKAFSLHPEILVAAQNLARTIRSRMELRRYELITLVTASRLRCTY